MSEPSHIVKRVYGTDNTSNLSTSRFRKNGVYFYELNNIDVDDAGRMHRRDGYSASVEAGTAIRSLWANKDICLYLDGTNFKKLTSGYVSNTLISDVSSNDRFSYAENGNRVYFANTSIIGYVDVTTGLPYPFPDPLKDYKVRMVGGQVLEFYNSRLYAAHGINLFFSDATIPTRMDQRKNAISFKSRITMVRGVDDGMYVSDSDNTYFESGKSPISEFVERKVLDCHAVEGMSIVVSRKNKQAVKVAYWMGSDGYMYIGYNGGVVVRAQEGLYQKAGLTFGSAIYRTDPCEQIVMLGR